jgi:hypothetical protein
MLTKRHAEAMAKGEKEYQGKLLTSRDSDWKDEFILLLLSRRLHYYHGQYFLKIQQLWIKMKLFFEYFSQLPFWYQTIFVASVYDL